MTRRRRSGIRVTTTRNVPGNRILLPCLSLAAALAPQPSCSRAATENVRHKLFCGSTSPPFGHLSCPRRGKAYQPPAGDAATMLLLRKPEGCDSQPGASPWARATKILPAAMSIPGRQARYSFPPRHSFRALQRTARKRSPQATRRICCFFSQRWAPLPGRYVASRPFRHRKNAPAVWASAFFIFYPIFKERGNTF